MAIKKAAVIGAGVMGAKIAAQMANAGIEVELLDIVLKDWKEGQDRDAIAKGAIEKMLKDKQVPFMHKKFAKRIRPGNFDDHLPRLAECDLIVEAAVENPAIKSSIFKKIDAHRKTGSVVSSNTSTIPLKDMIADQSDAFKKDFMITHFFNPPRHMRLLELITSSHNDPAKIDEVARFMDEKMGKDVVVCNDTPGFIANRIGTFWIQAAINGAYDHKLTVEEADAIVGKPMGVPKTGIFGLVDLVGLDLMPYISKSLKSKLPADDGYVKINKEYPVINDMIAAGYTGRKGKGGFYRITDKKEKRVIDLETGAERAPIKYTASKTFKEKASEWWLNFQMDMVRGFRQLPEGQGEKKEKQEIVGLDVLAKSKKGGLKALIEQDDKYGHYAWSVLKQTVCYAIEHAHEITRDIESVDRAMRTGYNWEKGPFEIVDSLGVDYFISRLKKDGDAVPAFLQQASGKSFYRVENGKQQFLNEKGAYENVKRPDGVLLLSDIKLASKPVLTNKSASVWDAGDGVLCLEFHTDSNSLDDKIMKMINEACDLIEGNKDKYKALVIHNEGSVFSGGANLKRAVSRLLLGDYATVEDMVKQGQDTYKRLKYASFPVVSAPSGVALGGGCEVLLHSTHVQAHAETYPGLVEVGVGLLPAWGGSTELLTRAQLAQAKGKMPGGPMPPLMNVFTTISTAKVGSSAYEAKDLFYLRETDGVTMNKSRLLADAKAKALELAKDFKPELPVDLSLPGAGGLATLSNGVDAFLKKGDATPYDVVVSDKVAQVLTGGDLARPGVVVTQDYVRELERQKFMELLHDERTIDRIIYFFRNKKPLREKPVQGASGAELRASQDKPNPLSRFLRVFTAKEKFNQVASNDNAAYVKADNKPKFNWPRLPSK